MDVMVRTIRHGCVLVCIVLLLVNVAFAQTEDTCPAFVEQALDAVSESCGAMGRNTVCYGNTSIEAEFNAEANPTFAVPGDIADVVDLQHLATAPLLPEENIWGVAMMALQANLPDTSPGENVTFIVFGDAEVTPDDAAADGYEAPMQAFQLDTQITGINCQDVPESGLLVQAPEETTVNFLINGVEVKVGSSAMMQIDGGDLTVDTIEGFVEVTSAGVTEVAGEGTTVRVPRGRRPLRAALTRAARVQNAPWRLLPRRVQAMPPPPEGQIVSLNDCFYANVRRAERNSVTVRAGEPVVLRFSIPFNAVSLARILQKQTRSTLSVNDEPIRPYTHIGPWRGERDEFGENFGMEFYWLIETPAADELQISLEIESLSGGAIHTGVDGPDTDTEPEILPARRVTYCMVEVGNL